MLTLLTHIYVHLQGGQCNHSVLTWVLEIQTPGSQSYVRNKLTTEPSPSNIF